MTQRDILARVPLGDATFELAREVVLASSYDGPSGASVVRDQEAGRLDTVSYDHLEGRWVADPGITRYLFEEGYAERAGELSREDAEEVARELGIPLPGEQEMMAITDEAEGSTP